MSQHQSTAKEHTHSKVIEVCFSSRSGHHAHLEKSVGVADVILRLATICELSLGLFIARGFHVDVEDAPAAEACGVWLEGTWGLQI